MNKSITLFLLLIFLSAFARAQELDPVEVKVSLYPHRFAEPEELAALINSDFETETDKAKAIYTWIAMNVKLDVKAHFARKKRKRLKYKDAIDRAQKIRQQAARLENRAISENISTDEGYAVLFKRLCDLTDVYGYIIKGTAKVQPYNIGIQPRIQNHSWNVIQINKDWFLVDAAMGAGTVDYKEKTYLHEYNNKFFLTPPDQFFLTHYPRETKWSLTKKTADDFAKLPLFYGEYLKSGFNLITPETGVLSLKGKDSIEFRIQSKKPVEKITYQYLFEEDHTEVQIEEKDGEYVFYVPFTTKRRGYLNLFYQRKPIFSFKIAEY